MSSSSLQTYRIIQSKARIPPKYVQFHCVDAIKCTVQTEMDLFRGTQKMSFAMLIIRLYSLRSAPYFTVCAFFFSLILISFDPNSMRLLTQNT